MQENQLIQHLARYYRTHRPDMIQPEVTLNWVNRTGWESEIYAYTLTFGPEAQRLSVQRVLRLMTGGGLDGACGEYQALSLLHTAGYPVPEVYAVGKATDGLGRPFIIMQRIEGGSFAARFPRNPEEDRAALTTFIALFRRLHTLNWRPAVEDPGRFAPPNQPYHHFDRSLAKYASYLSQPPLSDFLPVVRWLEKQRRRAPCEASVPVHQDFHPDNILEDENGKLYVIDWTNFEISDYRFDLAWTLTLAYAYGGSQKRTPLLAEYERQMRDRVPELAVFEVHAILRRLGSILLSLSQGADSLGMRPEAVEAMQRERQPVARLHQRLQSLCGIAVPAVKRFLESQP